MPDSLYYGGYAEPELRKPWIKLAVQPGSRIAEHTAPLAANRSPVYRAGVLRVRATVPCLQVSYSEGNVMTLTGWGVLLVVAVAVVAAIALIIRLIVRHTRGYD